MVERGQGGADADRQRGQRCDQHGSRQPVYPGRARPARRDAVAEQDVEHEQRAIGEGEDISEHLAGKANFGEHMDAGDRQDEGGKVAPGARARGGDGDGAEELDGADGGERQTRDGLVENHVHDRQNHAERHDNTLVPPRQCGEEPPGSQPECEHQAGACDAQPRDTGGRDACEQEHGEGRTEIVEDRAGQEPGIRGQLVGERGCAALHRSMNVGRHAGMIACLSSSMNIEWKVVLWF
ncbi:hypothetical protein L2A60_09440 [Acidiphilium iwatense]|uniref:Uncharacterized protein n=1 Tax=Acidiphilium iwatense TaxID=768198 RepID=A0ABS9DZP6_9PROT|nr:hypothetical protein [Acidiphilium iwatense]MCF3946902.1 hypothetical protein [Acidiphilium iwatense]